MKWRSCWQKHARSSMLRKTGSRERIFVKGVSHGKPLEPRHVVVTARGAIAPSVFLLTVGESRLFIRKETQTMKEEA